MLVVVVLPYGFVSVFGNGGLRVVLVTLRCANEKLWLPPRCAGAATPRKGGVGRRAASAAAPHQRDPWTYRVATPWKDLENGPLW